MADRLAVPGMRLAEEVVQRAVDSPYHPEAKHEPARAFAQVSRAVRFTLTLQARVQKEILALRNWELTSNRVTPDIPTPERPPLSLRLRARDAVAEAIERESPEGEASRGAFRRLNENLIDRETYDTFLDLPFRDCVEAICADLGLDPKTVWGSAPPWPTKRLRPVTPNDLIRPTSLKRMGPCHGISPRGQKHQATDRTGLCSWNRASAGPRRRTPATNCRSAHVR